MPKSESKARPRKQDAKSAMTLTTSVSGATSNLAGGIAALVEPKTMFDIFGTLPAELKAAENLPEQTGTDKSGPAEPTEPVVEIAQAQIDEPIKQSPRKSPVKVASPTKSPVKHVQLYDIEMKEQAIIEEKA